MRPTFDAALIAHLKARVVDHNEAHPGAKTKLGELRKVYERNFRRANPGVRALQKVEQHLEALAKGLFDEVEHPRDQTGEFQSKGSAEEEHRARQASDPGYRALTSDVVPDNRHEAAGALIRNGASVGVTAAVIGTLAASKRDGRLARRAGELGAKAGGKRFGTFGRKVGQGAVNSLGDGVRSLLRVKSGSIAATAARKAGAFGALSLAGGLAIRHAWKDSPLDPAIAGRTMDAYSYRTIQKVAASAELGTARRELTHALAKQAGSVGGSIDDLRAWLEQGGGDMAEVGVLAKGVPWGKASARLFSTIAGLGGGAAGGALGYGAAKITEMPVPDDADFEAEHPRDEHGRFSVKANTSRTHRFVQVGALLGGAAAAIATHKALVGFNERTNLANHATLRDAYHEAIRQTEAFIIGRAGLAHRTAPKRVEALLARDGTDPRFKTYREAHAKIDAMTTSDPAAVQEKVRAAFDEHLAQQFAAYPDMEIPTAKGGWASLARVVAGQPTKIKGVSASESEMKAVLTRIRKHDNPAAVWQEMLDRMVAKKLINPNEAKAFSNARTAGQKAVAAVPVNMKSHTKRVAAASKAYKKAQKVAEEAKGRFDEATTEVKLRGPTLDDEGKAGLESVRAAAETEYKAAKKTADKLGDALDNLHDDPVGVNHPIYNEPILQPTTAEIGAAQSAARIPIDKKALDQATEIIEKENAAIRDRQIARLRSRFERRQLVMAADMARSHIPKRARAAVAHLTDLAGKAAATTQTLAEAELAHLPNKQQNDLLEAVSKMTKPTKNRPAKYATAGLSEAEATAIRNNADEIRRNFATTKAALDKAETEHVTATLNRDGALAAYNQAMQALPPKAARHYVDPALRADIDRMRGEIAARVGEFMKSPTGANFKEFTDKVWEDTVRHSKAAYEGGKQLGGKALRDLFGRDDPDSPDGWRLDAAKVLSGISLAATVGTAAKADVITRIQRIRGSEESRAIAAKKKLHINNKPEVLDPTTGRGYWTLHVRDPENPTDHIVLAGHTFEHANGPTKPIITGASLNALRATMNEREQERRKREKQPSGGQPGQGDISMPKMSEEDRKAAAAAVGVLNGKGAIASIPTFEGGPSIKLRREGYQPADTEKTLRDTLQAGDTAVRNTLRDKHGLKDTTPEGEGYHSALAALFSNEAKLQRRHLKYMFLTGYTENGQEANKSASILRKDVRYGQDATEALAAMSAEINRVTANNPPKSLPEALNLMRAVGLVANVKQIPLADVAPLYVQIKEAAIGKAASPAAATAGPAAEPVVAAAPTSTALATPPKPASAPIDIDKPTSMSTRHRWNSDSAWHAANKMSDGLANSLGIENPTLADRMPVAISVMAENLHDLHPGFTETEAVGEITSVMHMLANNEKLRGRVKDALLNAEISDPGTALWGYMKGAVARSIEVKKQREEEANKSADHALDDLEQLVKISMGGRLGAAIGGFVENEHPRVGAGNPGGGEFEAEGGGHGGVSPGARVASEAAEAGTLAARKLSGGNGGNTSTLPGAVPRAKPAQAWYNPTRFGNEFGAALGFDTALNVAHTLLPEARVLEDGAGFLARAAFRGKGVARVGAGLVAGSLGADGGSAGGEAAGRGAVRLATGRKAKAYEAPESHGLDSTLANSAGSTVGGLVGTGIGRGVGTFAGRAIGGTLGSALGPVGTVLGGAALGYAGGKISEGIYDYFAGYDQPSIKRALARAGATPTAS